MKFHFLSILCFCNVLSGYQLYRECYKKAGFYCYYPYHYNYNYSIYCPIGFFCAAKSFYKTECPNNKTTLQIRSSNESDCLCKKGYYLIDSGDTCMPCPVNTYKSEIGNSECQSCPSNSQNINEGSDSLESCLCNAGFTFSNKYSTCMPCQRNTFKSEIGNYECQSCPSNSQNINEGSDSLETCLCNAGFTFSNKYSTCMPSQRNTFKSEIGNSKCQSCPSNSQNINEGSDSLESCLCNTGFTFSYKNSTCIPCPINTYKSKIGNSECHSCPPNSQNINEGSDSIDDCICNSNFEQNMANKDSFKCECQKGFEFNNSSNSCNECKFGSYKNFIGNSECLKCSYGLTYRNRNKLRTECLKYSILYGTSIAGILIVILVVILSIMFCKKRNERNENKILIRYY